MKTEALTAKTKVKAEQPEIDLTKEDVSMKAEVSLEDQIADLEQCIKSLKAAKDSDKAAVILEGWEAEIKELREQQKRARPLPARLQAATARSAKTKTAVAEPTTKVENIRVQMAEAEQELQEALAKDAEADAEVQAVTEQAAMGAAVGANQMAVQMLKWVAETLQLNDQAKAMLAAQAMTAFQG